MAYDTSPPSLNGGEVFLAIAQRDATAVPGTKVVALNAGQSTTPMTWAAAAAFAAAAGGRLPTTAEMVASVIQSKTFFPGASGPAGFWTSDVSPDGKTANVVHHARASFEAHPVGDLFFAQGVRAVSCGTER